MNDNELKNFLEQADAVDELPLLNAGQFSAAVRARLLRRKTLIRSGVVAAAAIIMVACIVGQRQYELYQKQQRITRLEQKIEDLNRRTDETLALVQDMLERQEQQAAEHRFASYQDPIRQQVDEAAFILVYQADRMMEKYNNVETAVDYYKQVIERFGDTDSARTARQRLDEIDKQNPPNQI